MFARCGTLHPASTSLFGVAIDADRVPIRNRAVFAVWTVPDALDGAFASASELNKLETDRAMDDQVCCETAICWLWVPTRGERCGSSQSFVVVV
jgi:hypothetical protein